MNRYRINKGLARLAPLALVAVAAWCAVSCGGRKSAGDRPQPFAYPVVPGVLTEERAKADYAVAHFWDASDLSDLALAAAPGLEPFFADWVRELNAAAPDASSRALAATITAAGADSTVLRWFAGATEKYLYDPNSPHRNEDLYAVALDAILASPHLDSLERLRPAFQRERVRKAMRGTVAPDFDIALSTGGRARLHSVDSDLLLLYFYNLGCPACAEIRSFLENSPVVSALMNYGRLTVLAVYPDEDLKGWTDHQNEIPFAWINARTTSTAVKDDIYDFRAIPTLYLLDADKRVIAKDPAPPRLETILAGMNEQNSN